MGKLMISKRVLLILMLFSGSAFAGKCTLHNVQLVNIAPAEQEVVTNNGDNIIAMKKKSDQRCASVVFSISGSGTRLESTIQDAFKAELFDGEEVYAQSLRMKNSEIGGVSLGKRHKHEALVCFGEHKLPIAEVQCEL
ncbi:hypothetical protein C942_04201 [Photobacterium marinum]|uniref:Uncharacterized protein n=1 Tax=Photobacterium marinum TaxID=1056511 RepID=L8JE06_9GAMM|nr:hypothetical protein [Photobacterium marinum]ELR66503.1 hypothetical protein C942_04201 [Photobacterium marinum]